ncbi:MAG: Holliday junction resolvase-like protein [Methanobacteriaceae archaeon]|jgi:predicted Holliday junction resolvase-like endonuclease
MIILIYLFWEYSELKSKIESRALDIFEKWRSAELETHANEKAELLFYDWMQKEERRIRKDAVKRSETVIRGKVTEHLIPFFPNFEYNPKDVRFIGTPVDLIIFDGLSEGKMENILFIEVKTGKTANLSKRETMVRNCVENKNVDYEIIHHKGAKEFTSNKTKTYDIRENSSDISKSIYDMD